MEYANKFLPMTFTIDGSKILLRSVTKLKQHGIAILLMLLSAFASAQQAYKMQYVPVDSANRHQLEQLRSSFTSQEEAKTYIGQLPEFLATQGFITASIDSVFFDSTAAIAWVYFGNKYQWSALHIQPVDEQVLQQARWFINGSQLSFESINEGRKRLLEYFDDNGYPFARVSIDSIILRDEKIEGRLHIDKGLQYKIDSIRIYGDAKVSNELLQRYLDIPEGSIYSRKKLQEVDKRLATLLYVEIERPSDLTMLGTGSVLNVYLRNRKTNLVNALVGLQPEPENSNKRFRLAGEANILLRNALGKGETIGLNWQQLQFNSPRLNVLFQQPYILKTAVGLSLQFDMFRKDTNFLTLNMKAGADYRIGFNTASVFFQRMQTIVNGIDVNDVTFNKKLPPDADVQSNNLGVSYDQDKTDYIYNPLKGRTFFFSGIAGIKRIKRNSQVVELTDPADPSFKFETLYDTVKLKTYQFRITVNAAWYFPLGKQSTFKTSLHTGLFQSGNIFRNELFQLGGYKLLRGFDEESQYLSEYAIGTIEYRYLLDRNSRFFAFIDGGYGGQPVQSGEDHTYLGTGLGMSFQTKPGIFNFVWALGSRNDLPFNLRQSKVHFGFTSYF